jgi:hypothetical protein
VYKYAIDVLDIGNIDLHFIENTRAESGIAAFRIGKISQFPFMDTC